MRRVSLVLSVIAFPLTILLIVIMCSVFGSLTEPSTIYNKLIYDINKETRQDVAFYNDYCYPVFKNKYDNMTQDGSPIDGYTPTDQEQMCYLLYKELQLIPTLNSKALPKKLQQYQIAYFNQKLSLVNGLESNCQDGQAFICKRCGEDRDYKNIKLPPICQKDPSKYTTIISNDLLGQLNIYVNLGLI